METRPSHQRVDMNAKQKGSRAEYEVRDLLTGMGWPSRRTPLSGAIEGWRSDITSPSFPCHVEVKNQEHWDILKWYKETESKTEGKIPIVVATKNREELYVFLRFSEFLQLIKHTNILRQQFPKPIKERKSQIDYSQLKFSKPKKK